MKPSENFPGNCVDLLTILASVLGMLVTHTHVSWSLVEADGFPCLYHIECFAASFDDLLLKS